MNGILLAQELYVEGTMNNYHQQVTRERKRGQKFFYYLLDLRYVVLKDRKEVEIYIF